jgi:copper(I)-binding protein
VTEQDVRTAPPRQRITRRGLQIALGILWLLDGALQLQPFMFGPGFAQQVLAPAADGQPGWVAAGVHWVAGIVGAHPAPWNTVFAVVQLAIGIGLLYRPLVRIALTASIGWAVAVWYFGEGLGGLAGGSGSLLTGAPGAVILYAVFAVIVWPERTEDAPEGWRGWLHHDSAGAPPRWTPIAWAVIWVGGAVLQALPGQNTPADLADSLSGDDMPVWQMGLNDAIANHVREFGAQDNWLLLVVLLAIGLCALGGRRSRTFAGWAGALVATVFWLVGQGFGDLFSGQATDPNTGPVLLLFSLALLGVPAPQPVDELDAAPAWRSSAMAGTAAIAVALVGLLQWGTTRVPPEQAHIVITDVYTPAGSAAAAPVYFTLTNSGNGSDTLISAGTEFQTSSMVHGVSVCANPVCTGPSSITIPAHSTVVFGVAGPHLVAHGTGTFAKGHQPLQLTLDFAGSGVLHVLSPIGSADDLTENDVMTYGFMGHRDPGMGGMGGDMQGMPGMDMSGTTTTPTMPGMAGKPAGGG